VSPGATTNFTFGGKTVMLQTDLKSITTTNVTFDDGSLLIVGDNTTGTANDDAWNTLTGGPGADQLIGVGGDAPLGDDTLNGGTGADNMTGGLGNDVHVVDDNGDELIAIIQGPNAANALTGAVIV
jgi:Ca2+-binding RTX toxin-like protein